MGWVAVTISLHNHIVAHQAVAAVLSVILQGLTKDSLDFAACWCLSAIQDCPLKMVLTQPKDVTNQ
jgi:hypothetical protein